MSESRNILKELDEKFDKEREQISSYIKQNIIDKLNDINSIADIQVHLSSQRQRLVDKSADMRAILRRKTENTQQIRKQKYRYYKMEYDIKLNDYEIKHHIESDIEEASNIIKVLENQIQYYKETIDTLDKVVYKIKYLIEVKKFLSGGF
jgi:hypothetical protein